MNYILIFVGARKSGVLRVGVSWMHPLHSNKCELTTESMLFLGTFQNIGLVIPIWSFVSLARPTQTFQKCIKMKDDVLFKYCVIANQKVTWPKYYRSDGRGSILSNSINELVWQLRRRAMSWTVPEAWKGTPTWRITRECEGLDRDFSRCTVNGL